MSAETWGIVLRDRATGAEQWVACEVTRDGDIVIARAHGYEHRGIEYAQRAVAGVARKIERGDRTLISARCATPDEYAAHMENLRRILAADEVERLRAAVAERDATINDLRHASNRAAVAYAESLARCEAEAFRRGAEAAMIEAAGAARRVGAWHMAETIRALPLPAYAPSQPAQSHEATETAEAPLTIADATARARDAARMRARRLTSEVDGAPRWLAPYLRPSPPAVEQVEAHRSRIDPRGVSSWWWVWFAGDAPMRVSFQVMRPKNYIREVPKGDPPWLWGAWPNVARTMIYDTRSITSEELRTVDGLGRAFVAPCDVAGNPMEWP